MKKEIHFKLEDKSLFILVFLFFFIFVCYEIVAYDNDMQLGVPPTLGHSAGEIHVEYGGDIVKLQGAINDIEAELSSARVITDFSDCITTQTPESSCNKYCSPSAINNCCKSQCPEDYIQVGTISYASDAWYMRIKEIKCCRMKIEYGS